ncbi:putative membrane protein [Clostridium sp. CAG:167]|nr:putative membrane protein [Clostridium sp. CAG:167]
MKMRNWNQKCKFYLMNLSQWVWLLFLYVIFVIALGNLTQKSFLSVLLLPVVLFGVDKLFRREKLVPTRWNYQIAWFCVSAICAVIMFVIAYSVRVQSLSWDWGKVIRSASEYTLTGGLEDAAYFARYPNNQLWYVVLAAFFGIIHKISPGAGVEEFYLASIAFGCVMTVMSILLLHHIAVIVWDEKKALIVGMMAWLCVPLYLWAMYAYTDTAGMLLLMTMLYCYVKAVNSNTNRMFNLWICLFGVFAAVSFLIKVTVFIFAIAAILMFVLQKLPWKKIVLGLLIVLVSFSGTYSLCNWAVSTVIPLEEPFCDAHEFPLTHWIMMSLGYGGYQEKDVQYTESFNSYEKKKEANIEEIKKRLKGRSLSQNFRFFAYDKQVRTWGDSTFSCCDYLSREPKNPDGFLEKFVTMDGSKNWMLLLYTSLYYAMILVGMLLSVCYTVRQKSYSDRKKIPIFACAVSMLGIGLFQTIWECNSRYLVVFIPIMILLAFDGYYSWRKQRREESIS